jgi:hypothetical protein
MYRTDELDTDGVLVHLAPVMTSERLDLQEPEDEFLTSRQPGLRLDGDNLPFPHADIPLLI